MAKKAREKKPRRLIFWFDDRKAAVAACETLGVSSRKVAPLDLPKYSGEYSQTTGHYGSKAVNDGVLRVKLRFKVSVDETVYNDLSPENQSNLGHLDSNVHWIITP